MGVFPPGRLRPVPHRRLPHARGGVSATTAMLTLARGSSPRPWGCFYLKPNRSPAGLVFPTPVGVFPHSVANCPHSRSLPHARGGVSTTTAMLTLDRGSSPRPWGCFRNTPLLCKGAFVFPMSVGVFPGKNSWANKPTRFPHARGGVDSPPIALHGLGRQSASGRWGWEGWNWCGALAARPRLKRYRPHA